MSIGAAPGIVECLITNAEWFFPGGEFTHTHTYAHIHTHTNTNTSVDVDTQLHVCSLSHTSTFT